MMVYRRSTSMGRLGQWALSAGLTVGLAAVAHAAPVITGFNVNQAPAGTTTGSTTGTTTGVTTGATTGSTTGATTGSTTGVTTGTTGAGQGQSSGGTTGAGTGTGALGVTNTQIVNNALLIERIASR